MRVDPLTGVPVLIVPNRQDRPNLPSSGCPFCPGGLEAPEPYETRSFMNRFPPLPDDRAEVVLYAPEHGAAFWELGVGGARRVVDLWAERTAALGGRDDVDYVLVFENRGTEVGATIPHPHGQIYAYDEVPPQPRTELAEAACPLCDPPDRGQVVSATGGWQAWVPAAATWPFELRLAPEAHVADLPSLDEPGRDGLAAVLVDALARLDRVVGEPMPYMLWFHQAPTDGGSWPTAHVHAHVAPLLRAPGTIRYVAAAELGGGVFFNPVDPAVAADALRRA